MLWSLPADLDIGHVGAGGAAMTPSDQFLKFDSIAFGDEPHRAVRAIHYPSGEPPFLRFLVRRSAEINTLDSADDS